MIREGKRGPEWPSRCVCVHVLEKWIDEALTSEVYMWMGGIYGHGHTTDPGIAVEGRIRGVGFVTRMEASGLSC